MNRSLEFSRTKRPLFFVYGLCGILSMFLFIPFSYSQPKLATSSPTIDLGIVYNGATKIFKIPVKNIGSDTLKILGVQTSCGCTTVKQPKTSLLPNESDVIETEFLSTGFRGKLTKSMIIVSNDPFSPEIRLSITADVLEELEPLSNSGIVWLGTLPIGKEVTTRAAFKNISGRTITIKGFTTPSPLLSVQIEKRAILPAESLRVTIKFTPQKAEYFSEMIHFQTDSKKQSVVPLRVTFIGVKRD
ncbi:MAG: DUF1573 domain-containing protein [bacterium]